MDYGHEQTDKMLKDLEKRIQKEYSQAAREVEASMNKWLANYRKNDDKMRALWKSGEITKKEYTDWRKKQIMLSDKWKAQRDELTQRMMEADKVASGLITDHKMDVYALNYNYGTYEVEKGTRIDTGFSLYNKDTVARLMKDDPKLLPPPGKATSDKIRRGELKRWNQKQVQSVMTQGILQGESIQKISKRLAVTVGEKNAYSHYRAARTMTTSAENAGRMDSYKRAEDMGIKMGKTWLAAHDNHTRRTHRIYDGMTIPIKEEFAPNLMFPGDPDGDPAEVYNCRCTLVADVLSVDGIDLSDIGRGAWEDNWNMDYDEWVHALDKRDTLSVAKAKAEPTRRVGEKLNKQLGESYEYHRISNGLNAASYQEMAAAGVNNIVSDFANLSEQSAKAFEDTLTSLMAEYDTTLQAVRTMTRQEALGNSAFASVFHDYTVDKSTLIINPVKCKDYDKMVTRIAQLAEGGYCAKITEAQAREYIATHEFAHSLIDMESPLKNKTNWLGADYGKVKNVRKEIKAIYDDYLAELRPIEEKAKALELDYILTFNEKSAEEARRLFGELNKTKISDYSLESADEFMAEAFTHSRLSKESNKYADRVRAVIDKHYKR